MLNSNSIWLSSNNRIIMHMPKLRLRPRPRLKLRCVRNLLILRFHNISTEPLLFKDTLLQLLVHNKVTHRMHTIKPKHRRLMLKPKPNSRPR